MEEPQAEYLWGFLDKPVSYTLVTGPSILDGYHIHMDIGRDYYQSSSVQEPVVVNNIVANNAIDIFVKNNAWALGLLLVVAGAAVLKGLEPWSIRELLSLNLMVCGGNIMGIARAYEKMRKERG